MERLDFVLWMILFPLSVTICEYIDSIRKDKTEYSESTKNYSAFFILFIWFYVGYLLY
jgi:hypothetical protein